MVPILYGRADIMSGNNSGKLPSHKIVRFYSVDKIIFEDNNFVY